MIPGYRQLPILALALGLALATPALGAAGASGVWINAKESVAVKIRRCAGSLCGRIVWLREPRNDDGELKRDRQNPDPERRDALLCGLRVLGGFRPNGDGHWRNGWIYNADDGETYQAKLTVKGKDQLKVRGYKLLPLFGRSQTWRRREEPPGGCGRPLPGSDPATG